MFVTLFNLYKVAQYGPLQVTLLTPNAKVNGRLSTSDNRIITYTLQLSLKGPYKNCIKRHLYLFLLYLQGLDLRERLGFAPLYKRVTVGVMVF